MYGAILGDIRSLQYKRDNSNIYCLVEPKNKFTDRTVSIIALADALVSAGNDDEDIEEKIRQSLIRWGKEYFNEDYSAYFKRWLANPAPIDKYDSDNTAAARAVIIPYIYKDRDRIAETAELSAIVTHGDVDNYRWSILSAFAVRYGMMSSGKNGVRNNFEDEIGSVMSKAISYGNIVVEAMNAFLNSTDVDSAIENAIDRGGNISTRAVIAGSIAEGFYGVPYSTKEFCNRVLPESMLEVLDRFENFTRRNFWEVTHSEKDSVGKFIENAIREFNESKNERTFNRLLSEIYRGMRAGGNLLVPIIVPDKQKVFDEGELTDDVSYLTYETSDGKTYVAAYSDESVELSEKYPDIYLGSIEDVFNEIITDADEADGIILNPDDEDLMVTLDKDDIETILNFEPPENKMFFFDGNINEFDAEARITSDCFGFRYVSFDNRDEVIATHFMKKNSDGSYTIHTPLMFYNGDDENVIATCCNACLDLAKKCHVSSVAFPKNFINPFLNEAIGRWFNANEGYGMTVIVASD